VRVALIFSSLVTLPPARGGAVKEYVYQLVKYLRRLGMETAAVDAKWGGKQVETEYVGGAEITRIPVRPPALDHKSVLKELLFGKTAIRYTKGQFDIVQANTAWAGFAIAISCTNMFIYICHNPLWPEDSVHLGEKAIRFRGLRHEKTRRSYSA